MVYRLDSGTGDSSVCSFSGTINTYSILTSTFACRDPENLVFENQPEVPSVIIQDLSSERLEFELPALVHNTDLTFPTCFTLIDGYYLEALTQDGLDMLDNSLLWIEQ